MKITTAVLAAFILTPIFPVSAQDTHSTAVVLSENTTQQDIDALVRRYNQEGQERYRDYANAGGCNGDFLSPTVTAYCWGKTDGAYDPNPTGGPIGASGGGSDGAAE